MGVFLRLVKNYNLQYIFLTVLLTLIRATNNKMVIILIGLNVIKRPIKFKVSNKSQEIKKKTEQFWLSPGFKQGTNVGLLKNNHFSAQT